MKKKKILALVLAASMAGGMLAGCGSTSGGDETAKGDKSSGKVYYLNFKPEQADQWVELAKEYTDETGVKVDVQTAASGTYESQLKSEMAKDEAPTLFQVNGPVGLATWKDYCYDLSKSDVYKDVESDDYVLKDGDAVDGIAYVIETYGLIYNKALLNKYFELPDASIKSIDDLNNFQALKTVAEEIQAHKDDLGVEGAFTSAGMDSSSDWRFKTHLANSKIEALSQMTNEFLEAINSDIRISFSGFTVLKSGKIRDKISISLIRDGVDCGSFDKFSEGEKARVNLANILALHKLTNVNCQDGKGLDLLVLDEILEACDAAGLANMFNALNNLQITSLVVSHGNVAENYPYKLIINKKNDISYI